MSFLAALLLIAGAAWAIAYPGRATAWATELQTLTGSSHKSARTNVDVSGLGKLQRHWLASSPWLSVELGIAALLATFGMLRNLHRLQDSDPVLTISPHGVSFKPRLFGEMAHVPWIAIGEIKMRKIKHQRQLSFRVDDANRYVPRTGFALHWPRLNHQKANTRKIALNVSTSHRASATIESTLKQYLAHFRAAGTDTTQTRIRQDARRLSCNSSRAADKRVASTQTPVTPAICPSATIDLQEKHMSRRLLLAVLSCVCMTNVPAATPTCGENSAAILQALKKNDFPTATTNFDMRMRAAVNADTLARIWTEQLPAQFGKFEHAATPTMTKGADGTETVVTPLQFANAWLNLRVVCSADGQVSGLFFKPGSAPAETTTVASPAVRAHQDNEHALSVDSPLGPLPGTLMLPEGDGPFPAVLLVAGSGPNDRDETIGPNKPFLDLARGLAAHGIASYRHDKRTHVFGKKMAGKPITVDDEVTDDAIAALKLLAQQPHIDAHHVFVLGHSLGALMVPRIVQRDPAVAGAIMLAAPVTLDMDTVLRQMRYIEHLRGASDQIIEQETAPIVMARHALAHANAKHPPAGDFFHAPASYWLSLRDYHAIAVAEKLQQPMLILQGARDYQVTPEHDFAQWQKAFSNSHRVTFREFPGLSHLFMPAGDPPSPADYEKASHVDAHVIDTIANWIAAQARTDIN